MDFSIVSIDFSAHIRKIINKFRGNIPGYHECLVDLLTKLNEWEICRLHFRYSCRYASFNRKNGKTTEK